MTVGFDKTDTTKIEPHRIYVEAIKVMKPNEIDHHGNGNGLDDLYLKVTPESKKLISRLSNKVLVSTFRSAIDGNLWYDLPFCYPIRENKSRSSK